MKSVPLTWEDYEPDRSVPVAYRRGDEDRTGDGRLRMSLPYAELR